MQRDGLLRSFDSGRLLRNFERLRSRCGLTGTFRMRNSESECELEFLTQNAEYHMWSRINSKLYFGMIFSEHIERIPNTPTSWSQKELGNEASWRVFSNAQLAVRDPHQSRSIGPWWVNKRETTPIDGENERSVTPTMIHFGRHGVDDGTSQSASEEWCSVFWQGTGLSLAPYVGKDFESQC